MNDLILVALGLIGGAAIGFFAARLSKTDRNAKKKLESLQQEFDEYKSGVRSHFIDTVSLLSQIDERQRKLYRSITDGVRDLCSEDSDSDFFLEETAKSLGQIEHETPEQDKKD